MALDETLPRNMNVSSKDRGAVGCTSIFVNQPNVQVKYNVYTGADWLGCWDATSSLALIYIFLFFFS